MANIKISELNEMSEKSYQDVIPIVDISANETKKISVEDLTSSNVELIAVTDTAPSECSIGDKYYNTATNKIYTAIDDDTWEEDGETPIQDILYVVFPKKGTYAYDGETLISVGGGSGAYIGTEEPAEDDNSNIWINPDESVNVYGNYISNEYGTSQAIGYSQEYINKNNVYSTDEVDTGKKWINGKPIYRKVFVLNDAILVQVGTWKNIIDISSLNLQALTDIILLNGNDLAWTGVITRIQSNYLQLASVGRDNTDWYVKTLVLEYTKSN